MNTILLRKKYPGTSNPMRRKSCLSHWKREPCEGHNRCQEPRKRQPRPAASPNRQVSLFDSYEILLMLVNNKC